MEESKENYNFNANYLNHLKDLIVLSTTTPDNNLRQKYYYDLIDIGKNYYK